MGIIEDIKKMQQEGKGEQEISSSLLTKGHTSQEIAEALAHAKIKEAVADTGNEGGEARSQIVGSDSGIAATRGGMQPSLMNSQTTPEPPSPEHAQDTASEYVGGNGNYPPAPEYAPAPQQYDNYTDYAPQGASADTIAEIAEQVVAEKMRDLHQTLEKVLEFRSTIESRVSYLDSRLQRIEKIIDQLQQSILQRVGEHMTAVSDLKDEIIETQKSFKSLLPDHRTPPHLQDRSKKTEE